MVIREWVESRMTTVSIRETRHPVGSLTEVENKQQGGGKTEKGILMIEFNSRHDNYEIFK